MIGFEEITEWEIHKDSIRLKSLNWDENSGWLYAFVVKNRVCYIGLTTRVLRSRMDDYRHIQGSQTNRLRGLLVSELNKGNRVKV